MKYATLIKRALLLTVVAAALVACLSPGQVKEAERLALGDARLAELLDENPHTVKTVRRATSNAVPGVIVEIEFAHPVNRAWWPLDACDIGDDNITGVRWLVDIDGDEVRAVTPVWGEVACFRDR